MNRYSPWRYVLIVVLLIVSLIYALPNIYGEDPAVQVTSHEGGAVPSALQPQIEQVLQAEGISFISVTNEAHNVLIRLKSDSDQLKAQDILQAKLGRQYSVALNLAERTPAWLLAFGAHPMKLGLDLRGGVHFLLDVDVQGMVQMREKADMRAITNQLREQDIRYAGIQQTQQGGFVIRFRDSEAEDTAFNLLQKSYPDYHFVSVSENNIPTIQAMITPEALVKLKNYAVEQNLSILNSRVNELGIAEPVIQRQGANEISVDLPGVQDMARAKDLIGKMATIKMQLVDTEHDAAVAAQNGIIPFGSQLLKDEEGRPILLKNEVILTGTAIINASPILDENGRPAVSLRIGGSAVSSFNRITAENVHKPMAVVYIENQTEKSLVDGKVVTKTVKAEKVINVATIQSALGNNFEIMGLSSMQYAQNLSLLLRSGAYSAGVNFVQERVVGPSLGKQNIKMGVESLEIGAIAVFLFMILYYRLFGILADMALLLNIVFIVAILSILGATLTLPGIAGMVLTVGMAVDANVLINERIREELRNGVSPQASINSGYDRAFATIVDANVTTLIIAVILLALGSSTVQGFAVTLIIGLSSSMVTAIFFTRAVVNLIYGGRAVKKLSIGIKTK